MGLVSAPHGTAETVPTCGLVVSKPKWSASALVYGVQPLTAGETGQLWFVLSATGLRSFQSCPEHSYLHNYYGNLETHLSRYSTCFLLSLTPFRFCI